jgi:hypothetical protein
MGEICSLGLMNPRPINAAFDVGITNIRREPRGPVRRPRCASGDAL